MTEIRNNTKKTIWSFFMRAIIICISVLIALLILFNLVLAYIPIRAQFERNKIEYQKIGNQLLEYEYPIIYLTADDQEKELALDTINGKVLNALLSDGDIKKLFNSGVKEISKDHGGIFFYMRYGPARVKGICYYPSNLSPWCNEFVTTFKPLSEKGWYYFVQR